MFDFASVWQFWAKAVPMLGFAFAYYPICMIITIRRSNANTQRSLLVGQYVNLITGATRGKSQVLPRLDLLSWLVLLITVFIYHSWVAGLVSIIGTIAAMKTGEMTAMRILTRAKYHD